MHLHPGLIGAAVAVLVSAGCATRGSTDGNVVEGVLTVQPHAGGAPTVTLDRGKRPCLPLLLVDAVMADARRLDGRRVVVTGRAVPRPPAGADVISMEVEGRTFRPFVCADSDTVLLVDGVAKPD